MLLPILQYRAMLLRSYLRSPIISSSNVGPPQYHRFVLEELVSPYLSTVFSRSTFDKLHLVHSLGKSFFYIFYIIIIMDPNFLLTLGKNIKYIDLLVSKCFN